MYIYLSLVHIINTQASQEMPTDTRRKWLRRKLRAEFRELAGEKDDQKVEFGIRLAEVSLDTIQVCVGAYLASLCDCCISSLAFLFVQFSLLFFQTVT